MDALDRALGWLASGCPRTPPTFEDYLAGLDEHELLAVSVRAQCASERSRERSPARALLLRAVAASAADALDSRDDR